jgi:hypothetical protein
MPIPSLTDDGLLPDGVHDCSIEEIKSAFGWFGSSGKRSRLFQKLVEYVESVRDTDLIVDIIVDGSFVTSAADPDDIDLLVAVRERTSGELLRPIEYNSISKTRVRRRFGFDILVAPEGSREYRRHVEFSLRSKDDRAQRRDCCG